VRFVKDQYWHLQFSLSKDFRPSWEERVFEKFWPKILTGEHRGGAIADAACLKGRVRPERAGNL
jgi:hypothetical protein